MTRKKKILFIIGAPNQTTQMHQISQHLNEEYDCWFSLFYPDTFAEKLPLKLGLLENSIMSGEFKRKADKYIADHGLQNDYMATRNKYDLTFFCTDMIVPQPLRKGKMIWVQEGMTDVLTPWAKVVKKMGWPGYMAMNTSLNGSSNLCDIYCTASPEYSRRFAEMGTDSSKLVVTGIPNYDNVAQYRENDFPHRGYVLVATSDIRECFGKEDRKGFLKNCLNIANGRQIIFKLHPNEIRERAFSEIKEVAGEDSLIYVEQNPNHMIANCDELITQYSTLVYVGIALGKKVHSFFDLDELRRLTPIQNGGTSAKNIADIGRGFIEFKGSGSEFLSGYKPATKSIAA